MRSKVVLMVLAVGIMVVSASACGTGSPVATADSGATVAVVWGREDCVRIGGGFSSREGDTTVYPEQFECTVVTDDPRASGREVVDIESVVHGSVGTWTGDATLTTDEGSWTGTTTGMFLMPGPQNLGETIYRGEGPYEGLTMKVFVEGSNSEATWAAWITETR